MPSSQHRRRKSSTTNLGDLPSFLENSPFFIPFSNEESPAQSVPKPTFSQLVRSKNAQALLAFLVGVFLFWYLMPRKGDISYEALGRWGLLHGGGAQCLYDPKALVAVPNITDLGTKEYEGLDWEKLAYVTYVTHKDVLCNSVMLFESLDRLGSRAKRVMLIPDTEEFRTEDYSSRSAQEDATVKRLLKLAESKYGVKLVRMRIIRKQLGFQMWAASYSKLHTFSMAEYTRIIILDSDATLLAPLDELFLLPPSTATMPRAYWLDKPTLASHIMVITPSAAEFARVQKEIDKAGLGVYDMEIVNALYGATCNVLPHKPYALLTGEFRRAKDKHTAYLSPGEVWDANQVKKEARLVHFSDYPMPKPWEGISQNDVKASRPACVKTEGGEDCSDRDVWRGFYREFRERRMEVCGLESMAWWGSNPNY
ncbi:Nucleotide-diphospho-sugar transferase [Glarea lozoyensis ATCC 20868]|uniref:Nucleotide-diphospho-sugar transferase n=1 Tax=Glarea lozoyensis (strain ATCC 20868 / MF5171) TaxID=1116229 RepID=S3CET6_GLAL2|nr:Nucleotide-diphospho-sugar transferase [Glarea lozoyensis ATCC 20868]EPE25012.1 Nucleotide-diphospho-sugar transferase [Glarea lozoyensis ATCC 20868]